jgi:hypothetical protein
MYWNECRPTWKLYMTSSLWRYSPFWALASLRRCLYSSLSSTHLLHSSLYSARFLHNRIHSICAVSLQTMPSHLFLCVVMSSLYCFSCESKDISVQFLTCLDVPCTIAWLNEGIMKSLLRNQNYSVLYMKKLPSIADELIKFNFHSEGHFFCLNKLNSICKFSLKINN